MSIVTVDRIELENFKGLSLEINFEGQSMDIIGDNGVGKTTVFDALTYLLNDEDSKGNSQFDIKRLKEDGEPEHKGTHKVAGTFHFDGEEVTLSKSFKEKYTGQGPREEMNGHTTTYRVNGTRKTKGEYESKIQEYVDLEKLRITMGPRYFNEYYGTSPRWKDRREFLIDTFGDVGKEDVIEEDPDLEALELELEPEDERDQVRERQREIDKELKKIDNQIEERDPGNPPESIGAVEPEEALKTLKGEREGLREETSDLRDEISKLKQEDPEQKIQTKIEDLKRELDQIEQNHKKDITTQVAELKEKRMDIKSKIKARLGFIDNDRTEIQKKQSEIEELEKEMDNLREKFSQIKNRTFDLEDTDFLKEGDVCPTCGEVITGDAEKRPQGEVLSPDEIDDKRKEFNQEKVQDLKANQEKGQTLKAEKKELEKEIEDIRKEIRDAVGDLNNLVREKLMLEDDIDELEERKSDYTQDETYQSKQNELESLIKKRKKGDFETPEEVTEKRQELAKVERELNQKSDQISKVDQYVKDSKRVKELEDKEDRLNDEYEELEQKRKLINTFVNTRAEMLESKINQHFELVNFRLFEPYKTKPGYKSVCQTLVNGVKYNNTLNTGSRIKAGLDIVKTFAKKFHIRGPVIIDNAESLRKDPELGIDAQFIRIYVGKGEDFSQDAIKNRFNNPVEITLEGDVHQLITREEVN